MHIKDKTAVLTYLDNATLERLKTYANGRRITVNQAVEKVVMEYLSYQETALEDIVSRKAMEEDIEELSTDMEHVKTVAQCSSLKLEKLEEQIAYLQSEIEGLSKPLARRRPRAWEKKGDDFRIIDTYTAPRD